MQAPAEKYTNFCSSLESPLDFDNLYINGPGAAENAHTKVAFTGESLCRALVIQNFLGDDSGLVYPGGGPGGAPLPGANETEIIYITAETSKTISWTLTRLNKAIDALAKNGQKSAQAERDYRMALAAEILIKRDEKIPVTIISDICRGERKIAQLKFDRDVAQAVYDANNEASNVWKIHVRVLESQIAREWGRKD